MSVTRRSVAIVLTAVVVAACGDAAAQPSSAAGSSAPSAAASATASPTPTPTAVPTPAPSPTATPLPAVGDLTGLPGEPDTLHRLPLTVMLDDSRAARPQSGFNGASIVYQSLADGFESRYLLVFQEGDSREVGPVRSARFYLVQWSSELSAAFAHFGGDRRTRDYLAATPLAATSVDGLGMGAKAYKRMRARKAPHNAYTTTARLRETALGIGAPADLDPSIHRRPFIDASPEADRAARQTIRIPYPTNIITYSFDRESNLYRRSVDGRAHVDAADGKRVTTTNVVVLFQKFRIDTKIEPGHSRPDITTIGEGRALVFREGRVVEGRWSKASDAAPTIIRDSDGVEIPLVRGRTFIQVVPPSTKVSIGD